MNGSSDSSEMRSLLEVESWCVDSISLNDGDLIVEGWAISIPYDSESFSFTFNDILFDQVSYPLERADIGSIFWYLPEAKWSGFRCRASIRGKEHLVSGGEIIFRFVRHGSLDPVREWQEYAYKINDSLPMPPVENRVRVHGGESEASFRLEGYSTYLKSELILSRLFGKEFLDFDQILDWGCGCGRVARYFDKPIGDRLTGVDVDRRNIEWNRAYYPSGDYRVIPTKPPMTLDDESFDLVIGVSIFTHLNEGDQFSWLHELRRVTKRGGILLMTVHGLHSAARSNLTLEQVQKWLKCGFFDIGKNNDLGDDLGDEKYYRNILHTESYIRENWSRYFDVVDILKGVVGNHQDVVVLQKGDGPKTLRAKIHAWLSGA